MARVVRSDSRMQLGFLGSRSRIRERNDHAQKVIAGALQAPYQEALKANRLKGTSPEFSAIMADLKRDNGINAFYFDMFQMARHNLEQAASMRSDDPLTMYYYGRVMKEIGRTKEDLDLSEQCLAKAVLLDTRHEIPEVQLHRALMLMDSKDQANYPEAVAALKAYIVTYERKRAITSKDNPLLPPNVDILYGYMRQLGEKTWTAPELAELLKSAPQSNLPAVQPAMQPAISPRMEPASDKGKTRRP
jgi:hypothetical protein